MEGDDILDDLELSSTWITRSDNNEHTSSLIAWSCGEGDEIGEIIWFRSDTASNLDSFMEAAELKD